MTDFLALLSQQQKSYPPTGATAVLRTHPEDFYVEEILGFEPEGEGEHVFLLIEKRAANTQFVAEQLAKFAKVNPKVLSFSGMKDRWAVTRQWFSVQMPGKQAPDFSELNSEEITVLKQTRHIKKLRRGVHKQNLFRICLREFQGSKSLVEKRLEEIKVQGVPNYFGEQRFGHSAKNLSSAQRWFAGLFKPRKNQQGIFLSAARSLIFNQLLSERIQQKNWNQYLEGDVLMLEGSHSIYQPETDEGISERIISGDSHITGPMFGKKGNLGPIAQAAELELSITSQYGELCEGLLKQGLKAERRALRVIPQQLSHQWLDDKHLQLSFILPSGCFATAVMAELLDYKNAQQA